MTTVSPGEIHKLFQTAFNAGELDALAVLYEPKAVLFVNGQAMSGHEAIRQALEGFLSMSARIEMETRVLFESEDGLAMLHGAWRLIAPDGKEVSRGVSSEVVRKQPDGTWRFVLDNPNTPVS